MDNHKDSESIDDLIKRVDKVSIILPEFQRDFVWDMKQTFYLFDSLVRNVFIGSIIYGIPSFEITVRQIDNRPRSGAGSKKNIIPIFYTKEEIENLTRTQGLRLILDGQQRVTSLYRALKGIDTVYFIVKNDNEIEETDKNVRNQTILENYLHEFNGQEDEDRISIKISDVYNMLNNHIQLQEEKEIIFRKSLYIKNRDYLNDDKEEFKRAFNKFLTITSELQFLLKQDKIISFYLLDMDLEKFALFFERSNTKGIKLDFIEILAAKLYKGFNLREKIEEFDNNYPKYKPLNKDVIVRTISYIVNNKIRESYILSDLTFEHFNKYWDEVCDLYRKVLDFLYENHFIISLKWMPFESMIIPLLIFLREIGMDFSNMNERQNKFIRFWYWSSVFSHRYNGAINPYSIILDAKILTIIAHNNKLLDSSYITKQKFFITNYEDLFYYGQRKSSIYKGILNLINYDSKGIIDLASTRKLTFNSNLDDHHIFPSGYLQETYKDDLKVLKFTDCILNRTLIPKLTNIKIGKRCPSEYINQIARINPDIKKSLKSHLIPEKLITGKYDNNYLGFLKDRAENIFGIIKENILDIKDLIILDYFEDFRISQEEIIRVFGNYRGKIIEALYYKSSNKILYKNELYTPTGAANKVACDISKNENIKTGNGYQFWKYVGIDGQELFIDKLRNQENLNRYLKRSN